MKAMEFAHQVKYYKPLTHFVWNKEIKQWYVFSMDEAVKNINFVKHIDHDTNPHENVLTIRKLLGDVHWEHRPASKRWLASNNDNVVLNIEKIKQNDLWLSRLKLKNDDRPHDRVSE